MMVQLNFYLTDYIEIPLTEEELNTFSWFIRYKAFNIYLWTKNNWKSDIAPGGANTQEWLNLLQTMIFNQDWVNVINKIIKTF